MEIKNFFFFQIESSLVYDKKRRLSETTATRIGYFKYVKLEKSLTLSRNHFNNIISSMLQGYFNEST